jgi:uncharacterized membrane protein
MNYDRDDSPLITAGTFLGLGLGGIFNGILFHQILQAHSMLSARVPQTSVASMEINLYWDGVFQAVTWAVTLVGIILLWRTGGRRDVPHRGRTFAGSLFVGWGLFICLESIVAHHILQLHHVVEVLGQSVYDYAFLAAGVVFIIGGCLAIRSARRHSPFMRLRLALR